MYTNTKNIRMQHGVPEKLELQTHNFNVGRMARNLSSSVVGVCRNWSFAHQCMGIVFGKIFISIHNVDRLLAKLRWLGLGFNFEAQSLGNLLRKHRPPSIGLQPTKTTLCDLPRSFQRPSKWGKRPTQAQWRGRVYSPTPYTSLLDHCHHTPHPQLHATAAGIPRFSHNPPTFIS